MFRCRSSSALSGFLIPLPHSNKIKERLNEFYYHFGGKKWKKGG